MNDHCPHGTHRTPIDPDRSTACPCGLVTRIPAPRRPADDD